MSATPKTLYLLDAFALIYRAHFAFINNPLVNSKGLNVSAITGFTNTLWEIINKEDCTHIAVAFDTHGPTDRAVEFEFYKANRPPMPEDIKTAIPIIKQMVEAFDIPILEAEGYEADDVIGTLAKKAEEDGFIVKMVTPDKDFGQLVSDKVFMYKPAYLRQSAQLIGVQEVTEKWNISHPKQVIDILGLMGDSSDNIPGVPGIGPKTAAKLLKSYPSVEDIIANIDKLKGRTQKAMESYKEQAIISKKLATIILNTPVEYAPEKLVCSPMKNTEALAQLFQELEFKTIGKRILGDTFTTNAPKKASTGQLDLFDQPINELNAELIDDSPEQKGHNIDNTPHEYTLCNTPELRQQLINQLQKTPLVSVDTETTGIDALTAELVGLSFSTAPHTGTYVPLPENREESERILQEFAPILENPAIEKVAQNLKYDMLMLKRYGIQLKGNMHDTMLAHYLIEPDMRHNLNLLAETYLKYTPIPIEDLIGKKGKNQKTMRQVPIEEVSKYAAEDADITLQLHQQFIEVINKSELKDLYHQIEMPLVEVLAAMEHEGVSIDANYLQEFAKDLQDQLANLQKNIYALTDAEFNIDSPKQLGEVLFDKLQIPYKGKKTKTGQYSTSEKKLQTIAHQHPVAAEVLAYRQVKKLLSTYVEALPKLINPQTNRLHTTFNQAVTTTGRLSSSDPNLQNIPIRTEQGRKIRKAFIPRPKGNYILLAADYSQIELRLMAHMSQDKAMIEAFNKGLDIHTATAARIYNTPLQNVDRNMRRNAKTVNFGIIYGISAFGLAQQLGISRTEASQIIKAYFAEYPGVKKYMDDAIAKAQQLGYSETLNGRRRYLRDINSRNHTVRQFAERNAINAPIQGTAADMIKIAMVNIYQAMQAQKMKSKMILQVHDELLFDAYRPELEQLTTLVIQKMEQALPLSVPIVVDYDTADNWLDAH